MHNDYVYTTTMHIPPMGWRMTSKSTRMVRMCGPEQLPRALHQAAPVVSKLVSEKVSSAQ